MKKTIMCFLLSGLVLSTATAAKKTEWKPAGDKIRTEWSDKVNPNAPLPEYPRPQMVRSEWMNLNGLWEYAITSKNEESFTSQGQILVPFAVESSLSGVGRTVGPDDALWYSRTFSIPKEWKGRKILLHFGAVDWASEIWINGKHALSHTGGYTPFSVDITPYLSTSKNQTIMMKVCDATENSYQPRGKQWMDPKGIWYTPVTGIWQTVWMEPVNETHIDNYYVVSNINEGTMTVSIDGNASGNDSYMIEVLEGGKGYSAESPSTKVIASVQTRPGKDATVKVPEMQTWSYENPYLYGIRVSVVRDGKVIDSVEGYTAMRKISVVRGRDGYRKIGVNNKAEFQFGPLDQGWWPDGLYTAPTDEALRYDIIKTRDFGYNMIRKHIKVEPARWYYYADVEGIYVWQDMPCIGDHAGDSTRDPEIDKNVHNRWPNDTEIGGTECNIPQQWKDNYYKEWSEIINALKNFQCIVLWVPFNEGWGQFDTRKVTEFTKNLDPTRLVNSASGGCYFQCGDIIDIHTYPGPRSGYFDRSFINVCGEYGGLGLPLEGHLWKADSNWGYIEFKNATDLTNRYEEFAETLKLFQKVGYAAAVYTQTTDVEVEVNGLMTYDRKVIKMDEPRLKAINQSVINSMPR